MLRIIFMGTPDFAVPTLNGLIAAGHDIAAVYCQPPRPAGRGMAERKSPVHSLADAAGLTVLTPKSLKGTEAQETFAALGADVAVVVAYGLLLPAPVLDAPHHGCLNLHPSKLPRWRGAAPIQRTLMAGDKETAIMVMRMDEGLDTGPICLGETLAIGPDTTAAELHDQLARLGADVMLRALAALERDSLTCMPQSGDGITYAAKIDKAEARINWSNPAQEIHDHIRGLSPFPGAWFERCDKAKPERTKILHSQIETASGPAGQTLDDQLLVACGTNAIRLTHLQRPGKKVMAAEDYLCGQPVPKGTVLG